jgi:hypothetical protein
MILSKNINILQVTLKYYCQSCRFSLLRMTEIDEPTRPSIHDASAFLLRRSRNYDFSIFHFRVVHAAPEIMGLLVGLKYVGTYSSLLVDFLPVER